MKARSVVSLAVAICLVFLAVPELADSAVKTAEAEVLGQMAEAGNVLTEEKASGISKPKEKLVVSACETVLEQEEEKTPGMGLTSEDAYLLAKIAMAEAETEDTEGKALVIMVVLNRVQSKEFPDSISEIIFQERQFSPVEDGRFAEAEPDEDCRKALRMVLEDAWDESRGATYFESKSKSSWHSRNLHFLFQHGKHYFYIEKEE